jgi:hypothetical protein
VSEFQDVAGTEATGREDLQALASSAEWAFCHRFCGEIPQRTLVFVDKLINSDFAPESAGPARAMQGFVLPGRAVAEISNRFIDGRRYDGSHNPE